MKKLLLSLLLLCAAGAHAQVVKFTVQQAVNSNGSVTPTLTWCTELVASSSPTACSNPTVASACTASGDWSGTKGPSGTQALAAVTTSKTYNLSCSWPGADSFPLSWTLPTKNDDGSNLTDLAGFKIYYSTSSSMSSNQVITISNPATTSTNVGPLAPNTYYVVMTAYNTAGAESVKSSPIVSKTLAAGASVGQTVKVTFPNSPTNVKVE